MSYQPLPLLLIVLAALPVYAQTPSELRAADPGALQQRQRAEERRRREEEREQRDTVVEPLRKPVPEAPPVQAGQDALRFMVREIRFGASAILSPDELSGLAREYEGRELSLDDLRQLAGRVTALYRSKGVVTAQAVVPPQDVSSGVVTIRLVEGRLGGVHLDGNESTRASYVVDRLRLQPGDLMDLPTLEAALIRFNRTNDAQLQAELKPGERFATTDLNLNMKEPKRQELRLTADTLGATATGRERAGVSYLNRSLLGWRDELSVSYTQAVGQASQAASYGFPVNTWGGRLNLGYYRDDTAIKKGSLSSLKISGKSTAETLQFRQPTIVDSAAQIDLIAGGKRRRNTTWIDSVFLSRTDTADRNIGVEAQLFERKAHWFASYTRSFGYAEVTDRQSFVIDRGSVRHNRELDHGLSLRGSLSWQSTRRVLLPSSEQFFIGSEGSVRGYPVGTYAGDTGQVINLELHHPLLAASAKTHELGASGFFFVDYGRVKPFRPPNSSLKEYDQLTGVGWGVHSTLGKNVYARLTFGYGLDRVPLQPRSYDITFQLVATAF